MITANPGTYYLTDPVNQGEKRSAGLSRLCIPQDERSEKTCKSRFKTINLSGYSLVREYWKFPG
jgi:hypothetical protein